MKIAFAAVLLTSTVYGQIGANSSRTTGSCSPAVSGNNNEFRITCVGMGKAKGEQILAMLNTILRSQLDAKQVIAKLDELAKIQGSSATTTGSNSPNVTGSGNVVTYNVLSPDDATPEQKKQVRTALANFMLRGMSLRSRCSRTAQEDPKLDDDAAQWFAEAQAYLSATLDASFVVQFANTHATSLQPGGVPQERHGLWKGLDQRIDTLDKFIDQFKTAMRPQ